jgi:predicted nucleotidyltransferase
VGGIRNFGQSTASKNIGGSGRAGKGAENRHQREFDGIISVEPLMFTFIDPQLAEVSALCRRYGVRKLELFGSAGTGAFDSQTSDLDFLVDFDPDGDETLFHRYFGLKEALEVLFGRKVDLVMVGALENPYFIESVNKTRHAVYAPPVAETA